VATNITVKTKIRINRREYASVDEMPDDDRQVYERMMAHTASGRGLAQPLSNARIVFNGQEYGSVDEMPATARRLYEGVLANVDANRNGLPDVLETAAHGTSWSSLAPPSVTASVSIGAPRPDSTRAWLVLAAIVMALWLIASFEFGR
jgi:hypothetical protein